MLSDKSFTGALQQASVLKGIVSSWFLSHYHDLFNLCHLVVGGVAPLTLLSLMW